MKILFSGLLAAMFFASSSCHKNNDCIDKSKIDSTLMCTQIYLPVCGCNDVTYSNKCEAEKHGVKSYADGPCK